MVQCPHVVQPCPVCGRPAEIRVQYAGRQVTCGHCGGTFVACQRGNRLLGQVERLLEIARFRLQREPGLAAG